MNISPIINQQNIAVNNTTNVSHRPVNSVRSNAVSFGSSKSERALRLLDGTIDTLLNGSEFNIFNKLKFHKILNEALPAIIQPENFINKGRESKVYRISDKYVAKIQRGHYEKDSVHFYDPVTFPSKKFKELDFYYGEPVVRVGKVDILKNATPDEKHVQCGTTFHYSGSVSGEELRRYETEYLPICSKLPQASFDNLARNLMILNNKTARNLKGQKLTYIPDIINPNNLLISGDKFVLVDKLDTVPVKNPNSVFTMLEPLLLRLNPEQTASHSPELEGVRKNIFKKILIAAEKHELPLDSPIKYEFSEWTLSHVVRTDDVLYNMRQMRKDGVPLKERLDVIESALAG